MIIFTIEDYKKYTKMLPKTLELMEESENYELETIHQYHDKIFKDILDNKKEFINFMKQYIGFPEENVLTEENIEKYNRKFVTSKFQTRESDIIYKIKNKNVFILIEHQSTIDYKMPERIVEYCLELIRSVIYKNKEVYPLICPIVLYTGNRKWDAPLTISENQETYNGLKQLKYPKYNLIDINNYTKQELLEQNSGISKIMLFEKLKTKKEIEEIIKELLKKKITEEERKTINQIFKYSNLIKKLLNQEELEKYKKILEGGEKETMENFEKFIVELLENKIREVRRIRKEREKGVKEGILITTKKMLEKNMKLEDIQEITGLSQKELENLVKNSN